MDPGSRPYARTAGTTSVPAQIADEPDYKVYAVRWPVLIPWYLILGRTRKDCCRTHGTPVPVGGNSGRRLTPEMLVVGAGPRRQHNLRGDWPKTVRSWCR